MTKSALIQAALLVASILASVPAVGQEPLGAKPKKPRTADDYTSRTLNDIAAASEGGDEAAAGIVFGNILPSRVGVTFGRSMRPLPERKKALLRQWAQRYAGAPEHYTVNYQTETLFRQDGKKHWLAIRKQLAEKLAKELKRGEAVDLFLIRLGRIKTQHGPEELLLVESYEKAK